MSELYKVFLSMSLSGALMTIFLLCLLPLMKKKLSRQWQYYIWLIVIMRMLVPFAPQTNLMNMVFHKTETLWTEIDKKQTNGQNIRMKLDSQESNTAAQPDLQENNTSTQSNLQPSFTSSLTEAPNPAPALIKTPLEFIWQYLWILWLMVTSLLLLRKITIYQSFTNYIQAGCTPVQDITLLERLGKLMEQNHIKGTIEFSVNSLAISPMLIGIFHPILIVPSTNISDSDLEYTILHELMHYRRLDILYKWLVQLTVCIHWFNPFVYVLQQNTEKACELSCDEALIRKLNAQQRHAYRDTLLHAAGIGGNYKNSVSSITLEENKKLLKERLDAIMKFQIKSKLTSAFTVALTVALLCCASFTGVYAAGQKDMNTQQQMKDITNTQKTTQKNTSETTLSKQVEYSVLYEAGEYFILFDGATIKDMPSSTGPDLGYDVTFGAVWPDAYVSLNSYKINENLTENVEKDLCHIRKKNQRESEKQWFTKKEEHALLAVVAKVQEGATEDFPSTDWEEDYSKHGITVKNNAYYYKNKRIRLLIDLRSNQSFKYLNYDKKGSIGVKITRNKNGSIKKISRMSTKKMQKMIKDLND